MLLGISYYLAAQPLRRLTSSSYNVNEGLLQSHIMDMNFDGAGFMWLSFETGLQRYDGHNFNSIAVQQGLPENRYIHFLMSKNGLLWMFHSKGISVYNSFTNRFNLIYNFPSKSELPDICPLKEDGGIVYFYTSTGIITGINEKTFRIASRSKFPFSDSSEDVSAAFIPSGHPINDVVTICFDQLNLISWNLKKGIAIKITRLHDKRNIVAGQFYPYGWNEYLYFLNGQLNLFNAETETYRIFSKNELNKKGLEMTSFESVSKSRILISTDNELYLFNTETMHPVARFVNFQNQPFAHFPIESMRVDRFGNIYLITRNEGFVKLLASTYPISYYGTPLREMNFITSMDVDKQRNRILAGSLNGGLLVFDTLQHLQQHIRTIADMQLPGALTISGIVHVKGNYYLLFPRFNISCVLWNAETGRLKKIPVTVVSKKPAEKSPLVLSIAYFNAKITLDSSKVLVAVDGNLYEVNLKPTLYIRAYSQPFRMKGLCLYQNQIITGEADKLCFLSKKDYSTIKEVQLKNCGEIRCVTASKNYIYAGCNRGLFKLDSTGKIIAIYTRPLGMPDDYVYAVAIDAKENIWCSTNKGIIRISRDSSYLHLRKEDGLQENEFNTNIVAQENDGELFFGGVNGINSFYPNQIVNIKDAPKAIITDIKINDEDVFKDSATWEINKLNLPYNSNNLYFQFTAEGKRNPEQYMYQYKMGGVDKNWIQSGDVSNTRYILQPGKYIFQLSAGEEFSNQPKNFTSIAILISPPFWQTWWFRLVGIFALIGFVAIIVWQYKSRKYAKKIKALQLQHEIQNERNRISRDLHDNIGSQLSFISSNIDWVLDKELDKEEELKQMQAINATAKNVMINLRETIWALHKETITLQEFSDKLKSYIQNILQLQPGLEFRSEEHITNNIVLTPTEMLNIFRIYQECINNVIKHAEASLLQLMIHSDEHSFSIIIQDNGKGFDISAQFPGHYGLINMKHRATEFNARLEVDSKKGQGTIISIVK